MTYQRPQCGGIQVWLRALLLVALVVSLGIRVSAAQASSYTCGDGASNHCYAVVWWQDANSPAAINAAYTTMSVVALRATPQFPNFIDDEMWLTDSPNNGCSTLQTKCWVELGEKADTTIQSSGNAFWFWADARPNGSGGSYNQHNAALVQGGDLGGSAGMEVYNSSTNQYTATISANSGVIFSGNSTNNTMHTNSELLGMELAGTNGSNAPTATFTNNEYYLPSGYWFYQGTPTWQRFWNTPTAGSYIPNSTGGTVTTVCAC